MNELRTTVGRLQTAVQPPSSYHFRQPERWGLAAAILARYGQGTALWQPLSPLFLEMGGGQTAVTHHHSHHHTQYQLRPRLNLVLVQRSPHPDAESASPGMPRNTTAPGWQSKRPFTGPQQMNLLAERLQRQETTQRTEIQTLTRRLNQQHQVINMLTPQPSPVLAAAEREMAERERPFTPQPPPNTPAQAVPRILRQPAAAKVEAPPKPPEPVAEPAAPFGAARWEMGNQQKMGMETAVDVNRLTDEVMQKLENRLQAHRERTGRF